MAAENSLDGDPVALLPTRTLQAYSRHTAPPLRTAVMLRPVGARAEPMPRHASTVRFTPTDSRSDGTGNQHSDFARTRNDVGEGWPRSAQACALWSRPRPCATPSCDSVQYLPISYA